MTRINLPGADQAILGRLVVRQDGLETSLTQVRADVDRLTRATSALTDTIRRLPTSRTSNKPGTTSRASTSAAAGDTGEEEVGQRDWLTVTDPVQALEWLLEAVDWWDQIGRVLVFPPPPCWPWHPRAVVASLALHAHYVEAYAGEKALPVSDLLTRWVPTLARQVQPRGGECSDHAHYSDFPRSDRTPWQVHLDELPAYTHWWVTDRTGTPPGLTPR